MKCNLTLTDKEGKEIKCIDVISKIALLLKEGRILALKDAGGFHIVCNAYDEEAIKRIRIKKKDLINLLLLWLKVYKKLKKFAL